MASVQQSLLTLALSANEIRELTNWPDAMVEDYVNIIRNLLLIAGAVDEEDNALDELIVVVDVHIASIDAHGVTGSNIGTGDIPTLSLGGAVFLAQLVNDAVDSIVSVTNPDASVAPVAYDQTQIQEIVDLTNEMKGDINTLVTDVNNTITQLNDLFSKMKTANQMSGV